MTVRVRSAVRDSELDGHNGAGRPGVSDTLKGPPTRSSIPGDAGQPAEHRVRSLPESGGLRIAVTLVAVDPSLEDGIISSLETRWDSAEVAVFHDAPPESGFDGLLIVGDTQRATLSGVQVLGTVDITSVESSPESLADILLRIDAKLGRLTHSQLMLRNTRSYLARGATFSRRDLLAGASKGFRGYSTFPFVYEDRCEARHGCSRCIQACPTAALTLTDRAVKVSEDACVKCGLCAASCVVGAVQLPGVSDAALAGMLDAVDESSVPQKTLVLTCDSKKVRRRPGMVVEEVHSVGSIGARQIVAAAAASVVCVAVVCPDGKCVGKDSAKAAVDAVRASIADGPSVPSLVFAEGPEDLSLAGPCPSQARRPRVPRSGDGLGDYVSDLVTLLPADGRVTGLGLSGLRIADSCTLCGACVKTCPHGALRHDDTHLYFSSSKCTGCGACSDVCPEKAIELGRAEIAVSEVLKEEELYEDSLVRCISCGEPIGSARMVGRVSSLLGASGGFVKYCPSCRQKLALRAILGGSEGGR